ncbi:patatin-like phospholipase family protein [Brevibacillus laterosporus]|uniref:patatin-like phospholipase family protein n=1 Tax=Brevibacillus laterosporus TaxID=1465 RepID=UPI00265081CF|nr:patatin-like phospholipase family protein [Brevibacillus laterosporus]MDN9009962.1 patatin-like phospholipase family protein [Brevibacillus laterosporus]MDO0940656.1 patatin-like phospholipase family protein [Brevibacillus laterosporus]
MRVDAVFEGGGMKGIALIGAITAMEQHGYQWESVAGTSAGSIVAALLAAGYRHQELREIFETLNYLQFLKRKGLSRIPYLGSCYNLIVQKGLYPSDEIERFVSQLLRKKGIRTFGDLPKEKLRIIASDISAGTMLTLPDDLPDFEIKPETFPIAKAVRMSCAIPYFFQPYFLYKNKTPHIIVDGGLLSNFPVWLFDSKESPLWPTFGFRLNDESVPVRPQTVKSLYGLSKALLMTMMDAHDRFHVKKAEAVRTVFIPTKGYSSIDFHLTAAQRQELFDSGKKAAEDFLNKWDFNKYITAYRSEKNNSFLV